MEASSSSLNFSFLELNPTSREIGRKPDFVKLRRDPLKSKYLPSRLCLATANGGGFRKVGEGDGVIIVDHGSRRRESNLMLTEPSIKDAFNSCVQQGAQRVIVSPFFLFPGRHWHQVHWADFDFRILQDIPSLTAEAAKEHPGVSYVVTAPLGLHELLVDVVNDRINHCLSHVAGEVDECSVCAGTGKCRVYNFSGKLGFLWLPPSPLLPREFLVSSPLQKRTCSPRPISYGNFDYFHTWMKLEGVKPQSLYTLSKFSCETFIFRRFRQYTQKLRNSGCKVIIGSTATLSLGASSSEGSIDRIIQLIKKLVVPLFLFLDVWMKWGQIHPIFLAARVMLIFLVTKPTPSSVHIFVDQLRHQIMSQQPLLYRFKPINAKTVEVEDYTFLCMAKVDINEEKFVLVGILGSWWILPLTSWNHNLSWKKQISLVRSRFGLAADMSWY
ncbi:hypothetical protein ACJIZ3_007873 [Penstemon smallii]|uniref:Sirohydrochlorin ferrochelatase, chloroplastic n=1 Tax=Penstemon smallii TaxID=265156 RepID=A0ABD3T9W2_9LAMI